MILSFSDIMPDPDINWWGRSFWLFIRRAICLEADSNVKRERRESFGETWKDASHGRFVFVDRAATNVPSVPKLVELT